MKDVDEQIAYLERVADNLTDEVVRLVEKNEGLHDLLAEATRQDFGTPGWRERARALLKDRPR